MPRVVPPVPDVHVLASAPAESSVDGPPCPACGAPAPGRFCAACGEEQVHARDLSLRHFVREGLAAVSDLDSSLLHSLVGVVVRPGLMTREYVAGGIFWVLQAVPLRALLHHVPVHVTTCCRWTCYSSTWGARAGAMEMKIPSSGMRISRIAS
jgi:hypothetical protein